MKKIFTCKTLSIFLLISVLPLFVNAQSAKSVRRIPGAKPSNGFVLKEISASSLVATNKYVPGTTMNLTFSLTFDSPDSEYLGGISMTFPAGITPNISGTSDPLTSIGACGITTPLNLPIIGQRLIWGDTTSTSYCGGIDIGTHTFQVNVTIGSGVSGVQTIDYIGYGDGYGAPSHIAIGTCSLDEASPNDIGIISVDNKMANLLGNIIPLVTIKNYGSNAQNNFNVRLKINSVPAYDQTVMITTTLDPDSTTQVVFPAWNATSGNWTVTATNLLATDVNPANDSVQKSIGVYSALTSAFCFKDNLQPSKFYLEGPSDGFMAIGSTVALAPQGGSYVPIGTSGYKWFVLSADTNLYTVDTLTGIPTLIGPTGIPDTGFFVFPGLTYDITNITLYGGYLSGTYPFLTFSLYKVDQITGAATLVATADSIGTFLDIACDGNGNLFAIEHRPIGNGRLWSINKTTAAMTLIGTDLGAAPSSNFQDMEFSPNGGLYFTATNGGDGDMDGLYTINTTTGTATLLGTFPTMTFQVTGLGIKNDYPIYVGMNDGETSHNSITVFPNPATNLISVISNNHDIINTIKVYSVSGQLVYQEKVNFMATSLNTANFDDGYYFVVVSTDKGTYTNKFVVAR
jgi:hypothetical protein